MTHCTPLPLGSDTAAAGLAAGPCADGVALADGARREALRQAMHRLSTAESQAGAGRAAALCHALAEAGQALAGLRAYSAAESYLAQALRWASLMGGQDQRADLLCALAELATDAADQALAQGRHALGRAGRERARDHAFEAAQLAAWTSDPDWEIRVLLRSSDVLDRCGDHDDALQLQHRALVLMGLTDPAQDTGNPTAAPSMS